MEKGFAEKEGYEPVLDSTWGKIEDVVNAPLIDVAPDASWLATFFFYVFLPVILPFVIPVACLPCLFVIYVLGLCNCDCSITFSVLGAVRCGRPLFLAPNMWLGWLGVIVLFVQSKATRLLLFLREWKVFGSGRYWYHGEGVWCWRYLDVDTILKEPQMRKSAFGCVRAPIPDMFATNILVFLPNLEDGVECEWRSVRTAMHMVIFAPAAKRLKDDNFKAIIEQQIPNPSLESLSDTSLLQKTVVKVMFYVLFGARLTDEDADTIELWAKTAKMAIFPRMVQRIAFNLFIKKMKTLRVETVHLFEKYGLCNQIYEINKLLPDKYKRDPVVKLCDEVSYILCFAGINGPIAGMTTCAAFLQAQKPGESAADLIDFSKYPTSEAMVSIYKTNPGSYVKEACRLDPPVTSATTSLARDETLELSNREIWFEKGTLQQYALSMANRDDSVFSDPELFDPTRPNLDQSLTWNGAFGMESSREHDEKTYPRICPGRYFSIDVISSILSHIVG